MTRQLGTVARAGMTKTGRKPAPKRRRKLHAKQKPLLEVPASSGQDLAESGALLGPARGRATRVPAEDASIEDPLHDGSDDEWVDVGPRNNHPVDE